MKLVEIPAGTFLMGSPPGEKDRQANEGQVAVTLTKPFWLGKTEVTQGQFKKVMGTEPWLNQGGIQIGEDNAASYVDWSEATAFCQRLTDTDHKSGKLPAGESYRLPTEAQWEYACRAGTQTAYSFGDNEKQFGNYGWCRGNTVDVGQGYAHKVGMKKSNPAGLFDMHGNVWEWCSDWYGDGLSGDADPVGPGGGSFRVRRGGGWLAGPGLCRSSQRYSSVPSDRYFDVGFRVARSQLAQ
jgi:formylglycine-generating enzyme required for sulfatase activity